MVNSEESATAANVEEKVNGAHAAVNGTTPIDGSVNEAVDENDETPHDVVSLEEVIAEEEQLESDARAVLGSADEHKCTYSKGYVKRQPLYACNTCSVLCLQPAGVCYACSLHCHDGHDLIELYTKRNFRCDCGNSTMADIQCKLEPTKAGVNSENVYNHNFHGSYCTCKRPYPDPENDVEDEMIQCVVCEDWFHAMHLEGCEGVASEDFSEMICHQCAQRLVSANVYIPVLADPSACTCAVINENVASEDNSQSLKPKSSEPNATGVAACTKVIHKLDCPVTSAEAKALFLPENWRHNMCKCDDCMKLYEVAKCGFLLDEADTVQAYENGAEEKTREEGSSLDQGITAFQNQLTRSQQLEMLSGYNVLRDELKSYLADFASTGKVVREEDIKEFFEKFRSNKRPRVEVPDFCR